MLRFYRYCLILLSFPLVFSACSSVSQKTLTDSEYRDLLKYARAIIQKMPNDKISQNEKQNIAGQLPEKKIFYTGYKEGKVILKWKLKGGKKVKYIAEGKIMDFQSSFDGIKIYNVKVSTARHPYRTSY
ncbi:MAG: hypothetical protein K9M56_02595 [Victivallales bacterium]|nr:hypothetical protein [Victivallales bacterium]